MTKPSKTQIRQAARLLETVKTFEEWCRDATPEQREAAEQHPGGARAFYDDHVARLQHFASPGARASS